MELLIVLVSIEVVASKFLESFIASHRRESFTTSALGRFLEKLGVENDPWLPFFSTIFVVTVCLYALNGFYSHSFFQLLYVFAALFATTLNLGAAHSNYFGRKNFITEKIRK